MKRLIIAALLPFATFVLACGAGSSTPTPTPTPTQTPSTHTLSGTISLQGDSMSYTWALGKTCSGSDGYSDMAGGAQVIVKDGSGGIIATGHLNVGIGENPLGNGTSFVGSCSFSFVVEGVPDSDFYSVEVGHRGAMTYSKADMESNGWTLTLSLGQ